jgi:hypothetical protein
LLALGRDARRGGLDERLLDAGDGLLSGAVCFTEPRFGIGLRLAPEPLEAGRGNQVAVLVQPRELLTEQRAGRE